MSIGSRLEWSLSKYGLWRVRLLLTQADFKTNPVQAVWRRVKWRLHWKMYHPDITWDRFGYDAYDIVRLLLDWNYQVYALTLTKPQPFRGTVQGYCVPILTTHERL